MSTTGDADDASAAPPPTSAVDLGLDGYAGYEEIGRGGFSVVYRARQLAFDRTVAIKVITGVVDEQSQLRFERECRTMGSLSGHPNIVTVYGSGVLPNGNPYLVMEYLERGSLGDRLAQGVLPWDEVADIAVKIGDALQAAHDAGVLHRDVKPENIFVSGYGAPKLGDFGIARLEGGPNTRSGVITASVAHAAPEVLDGRRPDEATDVYSLGSTIYTLLAGAPAFTSPTDESIVPMLARIATQPVPDLRARGVPSPICEVLEAAMAKDVADRIPTARAFSERMASARAASAGAPAAAPPPPPPSGATTVVPSLASGEVAVPPSPTGPPSGPLPPPGGPSGPLPPPGGPSGPLPPTGPPSGPLPPPGGPSGPLPPPTGPPSGPVPYTPGPAAPAVSGPVPPPGAPTPAPGVTSGPVPPAGFVSGPVPTAPPSRSSGGGKVALVVVLVVVLVALVAGGVAVVASRSTTSTPPPTAQGPPSTPSTPSTPPPTTQAPAQTRSIDLSVGDCFDHPNLQGVIDGTVTEAEPVTVVPCDQPHQLEVVGKETLQGGSGSPFPGDSQVASQAATACDSTFQDYVGVSLADSTLSAIFEYPSASEWADGERRVVCSAYAQDGSDLTGSVQGSLR